MFDQVSQKRRQEHGTQAAARYSHSVGKPAVLDEVRCHDEYSGWERQTCTAAEHHPVTETNNGPWTLPKRLKISSKDIFLKLGEKKNHDKVLT